MSKSKHGPALFEVIRSEARPEPMVRPSLPKWWQDGKPNADVAAEPLPADAPAEPNDSRESAGEPVEAAQSPRPEWSAGAAAGGAPLFELNGGQVRLSFTAMSGAIALFGLLTLLTVTYGLGSRSGHKAGKDAGWNAREQAMAVAVQDEIDAARARQVNPDVFEGIGRSPVTLGPAASPSAKAGEPGTLVASRKLEESGRPIWIKGNAYVAVQHFQEAREDAVRAQQFLKDNGIDTEIVELGKRGKFSLVANKGFNTDDPTQKALLDQHLKRIQQIGQAYWKSGGRYKLEGQVITLTRDQW